MVRHSVELEGFAHENPVPTACRVGDLVVTGAIHGGGRGSAAEEFSPDAGEQMRVMFARVGAVLKKAGGSLDDIAKVSVRIADPAHRAELNRQWCDLFPDPRCRPARQITVGTTRPYILVQCEVIAMLTAKGGRDA